MKASKINFLADTLTRTFNGVIDGYLENNKEKISLEGHDRISIPDIEDHFIRKVFCCVRLKGIFRAAVGWLENLSSGRRRGDATVAFDGLDVTLAVDLEFSTLQFGYDRCQLKGQARNWRRVGKIFGKVTKHTVTLRFRIVRLGTKQYIALLEDLKISLQRVNMKVSEFGLMNRIASNIANSYTEVIKNSLCCQMKSFLTPLIENSLKNYNINPQLPWELMMEALGDE